MRILNAILHPSTELLDLIVNRVGLGSIASTVGITTAAQTGIIEITNTWSWPGFALVISMVSGVMFIIKLRFDIKKSRLESKLIQIKIDAEKEDAK